ncbi:MAG: M28 family peptidase [Terriglobia bacterium]
MIRSLKCSLRGGALFSTVTVLAVSSACGLLVAKETSTSSASAKKFQEAVRYLAGDKLRGRGDGTPELNDAAAYIAKRFKKSGLQPAGDNQTYLQHFMMTVGAELGPKNSLAYSNGVAKALVPRQDFVPLSFSAVGSFEAPLVFAGYGITASDLHYDDYAHLDVKDKFVIVLRHEPQEDDEKSPFAGKQLTTHSAIVNKAINAKNHGAAGMILVNDTGAHPSEGDTLIRFASLSGPEEMKLASLEVKAAVVDEWLKPSGHTLEELRQAIDQDLSNHSFPLDATLRISLNVDVERVRKQVANVVGVLPGRDPTLGKQAIVLGAHYDHLGLGDEHSLAPSQIGQIHHGADDNASGTSAVIELAEGLAKRRRELKRSIVFVAFAGEESGLLGSSFYAQHPAVPLDQTIAMLNLDMVGRVAKNRLYIGGTGTSPGFKKLVEEANRSLPAGGFELSYSASGYGASDHMSFTVRDVPVIFFFSGLHADYHKPSDTWQKINAAGGAEVVDLVAKVAQELDALPEKPLYVRVAQPPSPVMGAGGGYGPYFGSIPDMGESENGVKFADVRDGSPASRAGFHGGDVLIEFGNKKIDNLYDFTYALREHKPGDKVMVTVLRRGEKLTREVTLEVRK